MKKNLPVLLFCLIVFLTNAMKVNAQAATESASASESAGATESATASGSGTTELPDTLPETGSYDIAFFFGMGIVLIVAGFSGMVSSKHILKEFD